MGEKTFVFEINLPEDGDCHECSYLELFQQHLEKENNTKSNDPFASADAEEEKRLSELAKSLERKYGTMVTMRNSGKHKRVRIDDFLDPGDGYDTEDSFIDDSEAIDVFVAPNINTRFGGFFVHQGTVEGLEDQNAKIEAPWNPRNLTNNNAIQIPIRKKNKSKELLDRAVKCLSTPNAAKLKASQNTPRNQMQNLDSVFDAVLSSQNSTAKPDVSENDKPSKKSLVNAQCGSSESDTMPESKNTTNPSATKAELPPGLPSDLVVCLGNLIKLQTVNGGQQRRVLSKSFDTELLQLDAILKETKLVQSTRSSIFHYLESNLQLKHKTLFRRIRKLREDQQERRINPLLDALAEVISQSMPKLMESYAHDKEVYVERVKAWQIEVEKMDVEALEPTAENANGPTNPNKKPPKPGPPKKLYRWNVECRQLFEKIILCRLESYQTLNVKGPCEEYLRRLFPTLMQLWPEGWITNAALWRAASPIFQRFCDTHSIRKNSSTETSQQTNRLATSNTNTSVTESHNSSQELPTPNRHPVTTPPKSCSTPQNAQTNSQSLPPGLGTVSRSTTISKSNISTNSKSTPIVSLNSIPNTQTNTISLSLNQIKQPTTTIHTKLNPISPTSPSLNIKPNMRITSTSIIQSTGSVKNSGSNKCPLTTPPPPLTTATSTTTTTTTTTTTDAGCVRLSYVLQSKSNLSTNSNSTSTTAGPIPTSSSSQLNTNENNPNNRSVNTFVPLRLISAASNMQAALLVSKALQLCSESTSPTSTDTSGSANLVRYSLPQVQNQPNSAHDSRSNTISKTILTDTHTLSHSIINPRPNESLQTLSRDSTRHSSQPSYPSAAALLSHQQIEQLQRSSGRLSLNLNPSLATAASLLLHAQPPPAHQQTTSHHSPNSTDHVSPQGLQPTSTHSNVYAHMPQNSSFVGHMGSHPKQTYGNPS